MIDAILLGLVALAMAGDTASAQEAEQTPVKTTIPFERPLVPPSADYSGDFARPPVSHWSVELPGNRVNAATHAERARPVVRDEVLYVGAAGGNALYKLSRRNGAVLGKFPAAGSVESEPWVSDTHVYFTDTAGRTWCYTLAGELVWKHNSGAPILVRPTVEDGIVYITNVSDLAVALDATTGELLWRYQRKADLTREAELALFAAPPATITGDIAVLGFSDGAVIAIDRVKGDVVWERRVGEGRYPDIVAGTVAWGNDIFASGYFRPVVAIDKATHNVRWRMEHGAADAPIVDPDRGILFHPGTDGRMRAIYALTGALAWTWKSGTTGSLTTPVLTPAGLLVGSSEGGVYMVDPDTGLDLWRVDEGKLLEGVTAAPVVAGRQLLFVSNSGRLYSMLVPKPSPKASDFRQFFDVTAKGDGDVVAAE